MIFRTLLFTGLLLGSLSASAESRLVAVNSYAAAVNDRVITDGEVQNAVDPVLRRLQKQMRPQELAAQAEQIEVRLRQAEERLQRVRATSEHAPPEHLAELEQDQAGLQRALRALRDSKTGEVVYGPQRLEGVKGFYASPVGAAGRVYLAGREGVTLVLKEGPEFEVLAANSLDDGFDPSPAVVGDALYLRGRQHLYCIGAD